MPDLSSSGTFWEYLVGLARRALDAILQGTGDSYLIRQKWQQATATGTYRRTNDVAEVGRHQAARIGPEAPEEIQVEAGAVRRCECAVQPGCRRLKRQERVQGDE